MTIRFTLVAKTVATPLSIALRNVGSNSTRDTTLCDLQIVVLNLDIICVHLMYDCEVPHDTE